MNISPTKTRVLVIDDSALVRGLLTAIINAQPDMQCVGAAGDPLIAREMIRNLNPDVLTLDIEMPNMDGIEFLSRLMRLRPMPVVMVSTLTERNADATLRALELGAVDFVAKPKIGIADGLKSLAQDITDKVRIAARSTVRRTPPAASSASATVSTPNVQRPAPMPSATPTSSMSALHRLSTEKVVFIGASTGGTEATREVLMQLPHDFPAVMITQHMPPGFTRSYAARLDSLCQIRVAEAIHGERVLPGHAYIAPGGMHLSVARSGANYIAHVQAGEPVNRHMPSVEVLFNSAAQVVGPNAYALMLTGMGGDGAKAMRTMRDAGSFNLVQDEHSCVVFGMPREAIAAGAAHEVLPLSQLATRLMTALRGQGAGVSRV
jgi:two-component system, chemotaxis family, protein-glutamate methylesterase/glutaminase